MTAIIRHDKRRTVHMKKIIMETMKGVDYVSKYVA